MPNGREDPPYNDPLKETLRQFAGDIRDLREEVVDARTSLSLAKSELVDRINAVERRLIEEISRVRIEQEQRLGILHSDHITPLKMNVKGLSATFGLIGAAVPCGITLLIWFLSR